MRLKLLLLAIVCLHYFPVLYGQTVWTGSQDSLWNNPNNWSTNQVPSILTTHHSPLTTIYPNPVQDNLNITISGAICGTYKVRILSMAGIEVFSKAEVTSIGNTLTVAASSLAGGIYMVEIIDSTGCKQLKTFVKQ